MFSQYIFIITTLLTVSYSFSHCNNLKLDLLQSNIGDWTGEYTIRNSISGYIIKTGSMIDNNNIESHNLCLNNGDYNIIIPENNLEFGLVVCGKKFIGSGENIFFKMTERGCIIDKSVQQLDLVNTVFPIFYSYDFGSTSIISSPTIGPTSRPTNSYSYKSYSKSYSKLYSKSYYKSYSYKPNPSYDFSYSFSYSFSGSFSGSFLLNSTQIPTVLPLRYPTILPTVLPTSLPTAFPLRCPTILPTSVSTNLPTVFPLRYPTSLPTVYPTIFPLRYPTILPTVLPTVQSLPIALFNTAITLSVTTNTPFDKQTQYAICSATSITLNINVNDCNYQNTAFTSSLAHKLLSGYTATSSMSITVQTANPSLFFASATNTLSSAASSGLFTANLVSACQSIGITNTATVIGATTSGLQIIQPPTISPTFSPSLNITHIGFTSKFTFWNVETIVSISVFGSIFVLFIMYYYYHRNLSYIMTNSYIIPENIDNNYKTINDDNSICINDIDIVVDLSDNIVDDFTNNIVDLSDNIVDDLTNNIVDDLTNNIVDLSDNIVDDFTNNIVDDFTNNIVDVSDSIVDDFTNNIVDVSDNIVDVIPPIISNIDNDYQIILNE